MNQEESWKQWIDEKIKGFLAEPSGKAERKEVLISEGMME